MDNLPGRIVIRGLNVPAAEASRQTSSIIPGESPRIAPWFRVLLSRTLHQLSAEPHETERSSNWSAPAATSAEYSPRRMPGHHRRVRPSPQTGRRCAGKSRLCVPGLAEFLLRPVETEPAQRDSSIASAFSMSAREPGRPQICPSPSHVLRPLAGEHECRHSMSAGSSAVHFMRTAAPRIARAEAGHDDRLSLPQLPRLPHSERQRGIVARSCCRTCRC